MKQKNSRISDEQLATAISDAVALEKTRIEQIDGAAIDEVSGGITSSAASGPTAGFVSTDPVH